jgi:hypothetical protein
LFITADKARAKGQTKFLNSVVFGGFLRCLLFSEKDVSFSF